MKIRHDYPYDPTNGLVLEELLALQAPAEPDGFREFWQDTYALAAAHKPCYHIEREIWSGRPDTRIYAVRAKTWDNREIFMWISRPEHSEGGILIGHGYGNPSVPEKIPGFTVCLPAVRGLGPSQCKDIPWLPDLHVLHGIRSRETYILRGAVTDLWLGATVMIDMFPDVAENLNYSGASMGGGMGALMLPWDARFKAAYLCVPTFGNNPVRLKYQSCGTGEAVRHHVAEHPESMEVLTWFDAAIAAKHIRIPTVAVSALFDPCVSVAGQFSVVNAIPEEHLIRFVAETGHFPRTERDKEVYAEAEKRYMELFRQH